MAETIRADVPHNVENTNRPAKIGQFLSYLHKFAVDSALNLSHKGFTGGKKLYEIFLQERLKDDRPCRRKLEDEKQQLAKLEDMNEVKQKNQTATGKAVGGLSEPISNNKKKMPQGFKEMELQDPNRKRIFIRSRL